MASVISNTIIQDKGTSNRRLAFRIVLEDNDAVQENIDVGPIIADETYDADAGAIAAGVKELDRKAPNELHELIHLSRNGELALNNDVEFPSKATFAWDTWDNYATAWMKYWLAFEDQLELVHMQRDLAFISNTDMKDLLVIDNQSVSDIRADVQTAVNTQASLDLYNPYFDSDGELIP